VKDPKKSRNEPNDYKSSPQKSLRKHEIKERIEKDIKFLIENPLKLRRFKSFIETLKIKMKRDKEKNYTQDHIKKNIEFSRIK
jgi:uncharacterized Zn finger protein